MQSKSQQAGEGAEMNDAPFPKIKDAVKSTGLSAYYLRQGCKDGTVPHVLSGKTYYINIPALLRQLGVEDSQNVGRGSYGNQKS